MQIPLAFLFGVPGGEELLLIFVVVLLLFGPKKMPEIVRQMAKTMEYLRKTSQEFRDQVMHLDEEMQKGVASATKDVALIGTSSESAGMPVDPAYVPNTEDPYNIYPNQSIEPPPYTESSAMGVAPVTEAAPETQSTPSTDLPPVTESTPSLAATETQVETQHAKPDTNAEGLPERPAGAEGSAGSGKGRELAG